MTVPETLRSAVLQGAARALGVERVEGRFERTGGGCFPAWRLEAAGRVFFVKGHTDSHPHMFEAEARGLALIADAGCALEAPRPLAFSDVPGASYLLLEFVEPGSPAADFEERLGTGLAAVHAVSDGEGFGFPVDGTCGRTPQRNTRCASWIEFFATRRLEPQIRLARARGLDASSVRVLERLVARLDRLLPDRPVPALVHGDLWSGNVLCDASGGPVLVDPAPAYAHDEYEFGMTILFGGFSQRFLRAYDEARPLEPGWRDRAEIYSVYHLLNHYHLFGGGYGRSAVDTARRFAAPP